MSVQGFEDLIQGPLTTFIQLSNKIGGDVSTQASLVLSAFQYVTFIFFFQTFHNNYKNFNFQSRISIH